MGYVKEEKSIPKNRTKYTEIIRTNRKKENFLRARRRN